MHTARCGTVGGLPGSAAGWENDGRNACGSGQQEETLAFDGRAYWALIAHLAHSALPSQPQIDDSYVDEYISISQFPLSAAYALGRITNALERKWGIV